MKILKENYQHMENHLKKDHTMQEPTKEIKRQLSRLFEKSLRISSPLCQLEMIRQKLESRGFQSFDKEDILNELGSIQHNMGELNREMLKIHDLLKQQS